MLLLSGKVNLADQMPANHDVDSREVRSRTGTHMRHSSSDSRLVAARPTLPSWTQIAASGVDRWDVGRRERVCVQLEREMDEGGWGRMRRTCTCALLVTRSACDPLSPRSRHTRIRRRSASCHQLLTAISAVDSRLTSRLHYIDPPVDTRQGSEEIVDPGLV